MLLKYLALETGYTCTEGFDCEDNAYCTRTLSKDELASLCLKNSDVCVAFYWIEEKSFGCFCANSTPIENNNGLEVCTFNEGTLFRERIL